jgi:hypothetical protein
MQNRVSIREGGKECNLEELTRQNALKDICGDDIDG